MKKPLIYFLSITAAIITGIVLFYIISSKFFAKIELPPPPDPAFSKYISGFTGGVLPTDNSIEIKFAFTMVDSAKINSVINDDIFSFKPDINGKAYWKDSRTIEFRPDEKLPHDKKYIVEFFLSKMLNVPEEFSTFRFGIITMKQHSDASLKNIETYYTNNQAYIRVKGEIKTADAAIPEDVKKMIDPGSLPPYKNIEWHHKDQMRTHVFVINDIQRDNSSLFIEIHWDGKPIESKDKGRITAAVPRVGNFKLITKVLNQPPEPYISLQFSEPLEQNQNLTGLVYTQNNANIRTRISRNEIKVFFTNQPTGHDVLFAETAIRDINGNRLSERVAEPFEFQNMKPEVRIVGKGVIMPSSSGLLLPFEAVNLAAVDVSIVKIYEDNIAQFLQGNQLDGNRQMRRVGRIIANKTLSLLSSGSTNLNTWNQYSIDLSEIIKADEGALYQVILDFKKEYSVYPCLDNDGEDNVKLDNTILTYIDEDWERVSDEVNYFGSYDTYRNYYYGYNWRDRNNPCTRSYYFGKSVSRNVLSSDLGIIAKRDNDGTINVFITDLVTTKPISGVDVKLYNFQQQLIETVSTDRDGKAQVLPRQKPFLLIAEKGNQKGYLRLDDGSSLSLSMFDVSGQQIQEGVKGYIYGERDIWRPGDTLFLTLITEDPDNRLPKGHPVVFELYNPMGQLVYSKVNKSGTNGFYSFNVATSDDDITGNWSGIFKIGGREFRKRIRIETIMPNRLRINLNFPTDKIKASDIKPVELFSEWLHGALASNLRAEVNVTLSPAITTFEGYEGYTFDDPTRVFHSE